MFNHLLIALALTSLSIVSNAAAALMDADQATVNAIPNAVLHKEVAVIQGGDSDKDVAVVLVDAAANTCHADAMCNSTAATPAAAGVPAPDWLAAQDGSSAVQPLLVALMIIVLIVFVLSRKSISTK